MRIPILAYHAILPKEETNVPQVWSPRHTVSEEAFRRQLDFMKSSGWLSLLPEDITAAASTPQSKSFILTFDDGHRSDLTAAAAMNDYGYRGIFYIPCAHVGCDGFVGTAEIKALVANGFRIGSHGLTHSHLTSYSDADLKDQLLQSRERLEEMTGKEVSDLAVPFGRYDRRVITTAIRVGYQRIMTSDVGVAKIGTSAVFPRLPVTAGTSFTDFQRLLALGPLGARLRRLSVALGRRISAVQKLQPFSQARL
jgi:peptidoglycan/xylan/chitin deacetylase (PgdA/CDA1 family)